MALFKKKSSAADSEKVQSDLTQKLTSQLMGLFDSVVRERQEFYRKNPHKKAATQPAGYDSPEYRQAQGIVENYALKNSAIAGAMNIIPGP